MVQEVDEIQRQINNLEADLEALKRNINLNNNQITSILKVGRKSNRGRPTQKIVTFTPSTKSIQIKVNSKRAYSCGEKYRNKSRKMFNRSNNVFSCPVLEYFQSINSRNFEDDGLRENEDSLTNVSSLQLADSKRPLFRFLKQTNWQSKNPKFEKIAIPTILSPSLEECKVLRSEQSRKELETENRLLKDKLKLAKKNLQHLLSIKKELKAERKMRSYTEKQLRDIQRAMNDNEIQLQELQEANKCAADMVDQMKSKYEGALTKRSTNEIKNRELERKIDMLALALEKEKQRNNGKLVDNVKLGNVLRESNQQDREITKQIQMEKLRIDSVVNELDQTKEELVQSKQTITEMTVKLDELQLEMRSKDSTIGILDQKLKQLTEELDLEKRRFESSVELHKQQDNLVQALSQTISSQDNHIQVLTKEGLFNLKKCEQLEKQLLMMEQNIISLETTNAHLRAINEKENVETNMKDKIIHYHIEVIESLKKSLEESKIFLDQKLVENEKLMMEIEHSKIYMGDQKQQSPNVEHEKRKKPDRNSKNSFQPT